MRGDAGVITAFGSNPVRVLSIPAVNQPAPYVHIPPFRVENAEAECLDAVDVFVQIEAWSLTSPPGYDEADAICAALNAAMARMEDTGDSPAFTIAGFRVARAQYRATFPVADFSKKTVGRAVTYRLEIDPL